MYFLQPVCLVTPEVWKRFIKRQRYTKPMLMLLFHQMLTQGCTKTVISVKALKSPLAVAYDANGGTTMTTKTAALCFYIQVHEAMHHFKDARLCLYAYVCAISISMDSISYSVLSLRMCQVLYNFHNNCYYHSFCCNRCNEWHFEFQLLWISFLITNFMWSARGPRG